MSTSYFPDDEDKFPQRRGGSVAAQLAEELDYLFENKEQQEIWLCAPNSNLSGLSPNMAIEDGQGLDVLNLVRSISYVGMS